MSRKAGWADRAEFYDENGTEVTGDVGVIVAADNGIARDLQARNAVNEGSTPAYIRQGRKSYPITFAIETDNFYIFRSIGKTDGNGNLVNEDDYAEWEMKQQLDDSNHIYFTAMKVGELSVNIEDGDVVRIEGSARGRTIDGNPESSGLLGKQSYSSNPVDGRDVPVKLDSTKVGTLQQISFTLGRDLAERGDVGSETDEWDYLSPGALSLSLDTFEVDIDNVDPWQRVHDGNTHDIDVEMPNGEIFKLKTVRFAEVDPQEQDGESNIHTADNPGTGIDWEITNIGGT